MLRETGADHPRMVDGKMQKTYTAGSNTTMGVGIAGWDEMDPLGNRMLPDRGEPGHAGRAGPPPGGRLQPQWRAIHERTS